MEKDQDRKLVLAAVDGDKAAYGRLYDRYAPLVRAVCYDQTKNVSDAQDLAQDVFLRAYERLSQLRKPELFGAWIVSAARYRCSDWRRQKSRQRRRETARARIEPAATAPSEHVEPEELRAMIARLPDKERLSLHVFYLNGQSVDEACRIVGLSRSGFYQALDRAREQLRKMLDPELENIP